MGRAAVPSLALLAVVPWAAGEGRDVLNCHPVVLGGDGKLVSWLQPQNSSMDLAMTLAVRFLTNDVPRSELPGSGGRPAYFFYPQLFSSDECGEGELTAKAPGPFNPTGLYGMLADSLTLYHTYSGDRSVLDLLPPMFDYVLANGTTPDLPHWAWPAVPYASSTSGDLYFAGGADIDYYQCIGCGDGYGVLEPDKLGEFGLQLLTLFQLQLGQDPARYRQAAVHYADVLCANFREPSSLNPKQSPWPFRVHAQTNVVREDYSAATLGPIKLLDELIRNQWGNTARYQAVRNSAWQWMMDGPMVTMWWCAYFEDIASINVAVGATGFRGLPPVSERGNWVNAQMSENVPGFMRHFMEPNGTWPTCNYNQYSPLETARYLMTHPESNKQWQEHSQNLVDFVTWSLVDNAVKGETGVQWGARTVSEQRMDAHRMVSHTSRYASVLALLAEKTANHTLGAIARRSWDWASYMSDDKGRVIVGPLNRGGKTMWFSDGYGDFIRNTIHSLGANASWAPMGSSHILRSSSVVTQVDYRGAAVEYSVYHTGSVQKLTLHFVPSQVSVDGMALTQFADAGALEKSSSSGTSGWWFGGQSGQECVVQHNGSRVLIA